MNKQIRFNPVTRFTSRPRSPEGWFQDYWQPVVGACLLLLFILGIGLYVRHHRAEQNIAASALFEAGQFQAILKEYPGTDTAKWTRLKMATQSIGEQKWDEALGHILPFWENKEVAELDPMVRVGLFHMRAFIHFKKQEKDKAIEFLQDALKDPENSTRDYTELLLAHVRESSGSAEDKLESQKIFQTLAETATMLPVRDEAMERLPPNVQKELKAKLNVAPETQPETLKGKSE